jgi:predicted dehydrogenase
MPETVTAVTLQIKPHIYPAVDDEATIILTYPHCQGIIQASWNWPYNRKDMDIYGTNGAIFQYDRHEMALRTDENTEPIHVPEPGFPAADPFSYFAALIRGDIHLTPQDLSSLENNLIVVEILDAARRSAKSGSTVFFEQR